jgi:hypothetical protein
MVDLICTSEGHSSDQIQEYVDPCTITGHQVVLFDLVHHRDGPCTGNGMGHMRVRVPQVFSRTILNGSNDFSEAITVATISTRRPAPCPLAIVVMSTAMPSCSSASSVSRLLVQTMPPHVTLRANLAGALISAKAGGQTHALGFAMFQIVLAARQFQRSFHGVRARAEEHHYAPFASAFRCAGNCNQVAAGEFLGGCVCVWAY